MLLTAGCGITRLDVQHDPLAQITAKKSGSIMVEPFKDVRAEKEYIGVKRGGFGNVVNHFGTLENVKLEDLLTKYFAEALTEAGYNVQVAGSQPTANGAKVDLIVGGEIKEFQLDMYMAAWSYMTIDLKAKNPATGKVTWQKEVKGEDKVILWMGLTPEFERVVRGALTKALDEAAKDFASEEFSSKLVKK
jgi:hypothetical protein